MPCSNAAKTRNQLKFGGVPQTGQPISATSRPKFTILWGHVEDILLLNNPPFPQIDIIGAVVIVWRVRGENCQVCSVQYCVQRLCTVRCTHMNRLTVLWIGFLSHWAHFTVLRFIFMVALCNRADHYIFILFMVALWNRADHYIFILFLLLSSSFLFFFFFLA